MLFVIETPKGSPNKLAFEPRYGTFVVRSVLPAGAVFPFDFGFVPSTRAEDGDPLDVLVLMDAPVYPGCIVPSRLIGVIEAEQTEKGRDGAARSTAGRCCHLGGTSLDSSVERSQPDLVAQIEHFFVSYNEMKGKRFEVKGRAESKLARALVMEAMKRRR